MVTHVTRPHVTRITVYDRTVLFGPDRARYLNLSTDFDDLRPGDAKRFRVLVQLLPGSSRGRDARRVDVTEMFSYDEEG